MINREKTADSARAVSRLRAKASFHRFTSFENGPANNMSPPTDWIPGLWKDIFDDMLNDDNELDYEDQWTLTFNYNQTEEITKQERKRGWKVYCHCAYGHFRCETCNKTWPSARVVVLFRYRLQGNRGTVIMRPFRQACRRCQDDEFELPGFSDEEVEKALRRLFSKIRKNCYDDDSDDGSSTCSRKVFTKPHEASLCEACRMGICCQDED
ncbi:receptor-transporting protein 3 [Labrus bergylta]|uniref:receptor-transporting protein 3 n=1 Tax=Labrus bergylta TaxID=56723 RepID=UPI0033141995